MKKIVLLLAVAGLASATAITFTSNSTGVLQLYASTGVAAPAGIQDLPYGPGGNGSVGGLCVAPCTNTTAADSLTFNLSSTYTMTILLYDKFNVGDFYQVVLSGGTLGSDQVYQSSLVDLFGTTAQSCYNSSITGTQMGDSCLDTTTGVLGAGSYTINIWDVLLSYVGFQDPVGFVSNSGPVCTSTTGIVPGGSCFQPAAFALELELTPVTVPEPATFGMLGLGGMALGLLRRRFAFRSR